MECMINSDNVVRGGLSPKTKDVETLLDILPYSDMQTREILPVNTLCETEGSLTVHEYLPNEYKELRVLKVESKLGGGCGATVTLPACEYFSMMMVISGDAQVTFKTE